MWLCKGTILYQSKFTGVIITAPVTFKTDHFTNIEDKLEHLENLAFANAPEGFTPWVVSLDSQTRMKKEK